MATPRDDVFLIPSEDKYVLFAPVEDRAFLLNQSAAIQLLLDLDNEQPPNSFALRFATEGVKLQGSHALDIDPKQSVNYAPTSVTLFPTSDCNLACVYCFASAGDKNKDKLDFKVAKPAIDKVLQNAKQKDVPARVKFHGGGEPFSNFGFLKDSVDYAKLKASECGVEVVFSSATNGILNTEMRRWVVKNIDFVSLSFDGPSLSQELNRPTKNGQSSFLTVDSTIRFFEEHDQKYSIRVTTTKHNVGSLKELVDYVASNTTLRSIRVEPVAIQGRAKDEENIALEPREFIDAFIQARDHGNKKGVQLFYSGADLSTRRNSFCGAHHENFFVTPQGKISTCIEVSNEGDQGEEIYHIGNADENGMSIDMEKLSYLRSRTVNDLNGCSNCFAKFHCAGDCSFKQYSSSGDFFETGIYSRCEINREILLDEILSKLRNSNTEATQ